MLDGVGCLIEPHRNSESMMFDSQWRWRKECWWIYNNLCGCSFMFTLQSSTFILDSYKISPDLLNFQQTSSNTNESTCSWRTCQRHWSCHALSKLAVANHVWAKKNWPNGPSKPLQCVEPEQRRKGKLPMKPFKGTYSYSYLFFWGGWWFSGGKPWYFSCQNSKDHLQGSQTIFRHRQRFHQEQTLLVCS